MPPPFQRIGETLGRYRLLDRLAVGGMAEIFLAVERADHGVERLVVLKRMLPELALDDAHVEMFLQEARIVAKVSHPNVVQMYRLEDDHGVPFMVMEYVAGSTFRELMAASKATRTSIPVDVAVDLMMQACAGVHAVHELVDARGVSYGLVHRDVTPHNLMVAGGGYVKVLDFGIAKFAEERRLTRTGMLKGKFSYMSPEQVRQQPLDRRTDVFSLGVCAWELLVGDKLFDAPNELGAMQAILAGEIRPLGDTRSDVPETVVRAIERALEVDRRDRWSSADAFRVALRDAVQLSRRAPSRDRTASVIRRLLGERHEQRHRQIREAVLALAESFPEEVSSPERQVSTRRRAWLIGAAVAAGVLLFLPSWVAREGLWSSAPSDAMIEGEPVVLGLAPVLDPAILAQEHEPIRRYLEHVLHRPVRLVVADSYLDVADRLLDERIEFGVLPPLIFLQTRARAPDTITALVTKQYDTGSLSDALLLVAERSNIGSIEDLRGGRICYSDPNSTSGYALPRYYLRERGLDPDRDLKPHISGNHLQVLRDLIAGRCDVGGTYTGNYQTADQDGILVGQLRIFAITGRTPHDTVVAGPAATTEERQAMREALLSFDPTVDLGRRRVGEIEPITGFVPVDEALFRRLGQIVSSEISADR